MSEKRRTRYGGEPPPKRRLSVSPPASTPTKTQTPRSAARSAPKAPPPPPPPPEPVAEGLPVRLREGQKLPTMSEPQDAASLSDKDFQSISESGVLKTSLEQSRHLWLTDNVFEKYWVKPSKKKGGTPTLGREISNPPTKSMTKLGPCSLIIEPHMFDCTLYMTREPPAFGYQTPGQTPPPPAVFDAFTPSSHHLPGSSNGLPRYTAPMNGGQQGQASLSVPPFKEGYGSVGSQNTNYYPRPSTSSQQGLSTMPTPAPSAAPTTTSSNPPSNQSQGTSGKPNGDPVIQMLASRAASDRDLKSLMKVVATGQATPDQLKIFQDHIDELNVIIKRQQAEAAGSTTNTDLQTGSAAPEHKTIFEGATSQPKESSQPTVYPTVGNAPPVKTEPSNVYNAATAPSPFYNPTYPYTTATTGPKPPFPNIHPSTTTTISHPTSILIEFHGPGAHPTRYLLPRLSILEYRPCGQLALLSFLAIRDKTYQPITIRLKASSPKVIEPLRRAVAPMEEVQRYMNGVFDDKEMKSADREYLPVRLPREEGGEKKVEETGKKGKRGGEVKGKGGKEGDEEEGLKDRYEWTAGLARL